jgi:hypothetical protein
MLRMGLGLGITLVLFAAVGCRTCSHPYDDCGPVVTTHHCELCSTTSREGSILDGSSQAPTPENVLSSTGKTHLGKVPGSEKIISVKDRAVEPSEGMTEPPQLAVESVAETPKPLPSKGWTARRPTTEVQR